MKTMLAEVQKENPTEEEIDRMPVCLTSSKCFLSCQMLLFRLLACGDTVLRSYIVALGEFGKLIALPARLEGNIGRAVRRGA